MTETLPRHLSASDSVAWRIESNPLLRSTITLVLLLDQAPNHRALRATFAAASVAFPRLRQRVVDVPLHASTAVWAIDPDFDLAYHMRTVKAGADGSHRSLLNLAAAQRMKPFDRDHSPWLCTIVDGLEDGRSAIIIKIHHAVTDGVGGVHLMSQLFDLERNEGVVRRNETAEVPTGEDPDASSLLVEALQHQTSRTLGQARKLVGRLSELRQPLNTGKGALRGALSAARLVAPARGPLSPIMTERSPHNHFESFDVALADLKAAARRVDGKLNDAFMTATAVGLRLYHEVHGSPADELRVNMPINLRTADSGVGGNDWAPSRFVVPLGGDDVDAHMRDIHDLVNRQRAEPALGYANTIATVMDQLPTPVLTRVFSSMLTCLDFAATNVPGAPFPLYLAGARVDAMEAYAPPSGAAVNFALLSYQDRATVGINLDPAAIPDADVLLDCTRQGFDAVITGRSIPRSKSIVGRRRTAVAPTPR